ncbi:hypothetical protein [Candidatus Nitrosotenuis uzonensis]|uniref:CARDB domain-containing protein n=1 Tax=Candidatus Nitrosotenuis uzonensis TaxID=1407055 RepID=V6AT41_9ARCH|nr:hypothetical protein [Candidatus Nitrosotenuis uzonensis]CDI05891.1 conserved exported hypothetical protein [Candidatus Nitrosotenuis uzonensis]
MKKILLMLTLMALPAIIQATEGATIKHTMDGAMDISMSYPDIVMSGRDFELTVFVQNNGWEDKQDIRFVITSQDESILIKNNTVSIERLSKGSSYGSTIKFTVASDAKPGTHYLNMLYSQVLLSNNEIPTPLNSKNIAIPIEIRNEPKIQINTIVPSAIFPNAEFPFDVNILSSDIDLRDVTVKIIAPDDVTFRGQSTHTFSFISRGESLQIHSQIITEDVEITSEHKVPFEVVVSYTDDVGKEKTTSKTVSLLLRPRTLMEFTTDGGVWIGGFFLAPYVSIGTLVGIPAGTLFSILVHRLQKKKSGKKRKTK